MIGEGPGRKKAEQAAARLGLDDKVHFIPFVDRIQDWLSQADLLIHPSEMESFGLVSLEAMSCGVPVVAYRAGGLPEVVSDGVNGYLLEVGDVAGAVEKATSLLRERDRWESFSREGQETARSRFSLGRVVPRYEKYFREVLTT